jgi:hypothetical protein
MPDSEADGLGFVWCESGYVSGPRYDHYLAWRHAVLKRTAKRIFVEKQEYGKEHSQVSDEWHSWQLPTTCGQTFALDRQALELHGTVSPQKMLGAGSWVSDELHRLHFPTRLVIYHHEYDRPIFETDVSVGQHYREVQLCDPSGDKLAIIFHGEELAGLLFDWTPLWDWEELHINTPANSIDQQQLVALAFAALQEHDGFLILADWLEDRRLNLPAARARLLARTEKDAA